MSGLSKKSIRVTEFFRTELTILLDDLYCDLPKGREEFMVKFKRIMGDLIADHTLGHGEPWPRKVAREGWEFRKLELKLPQLHGAPAVARLMYLVNLNENVIKLLWLYTHGEFEKRPDDKLLKPMLEEAMTSES